MHQQVTVFVVIFVLSIYHTCSGEGPWSFKGTTPNLREIIIGRCWEYQELILKDNSTSLSVNVNCLDVWKVFNETLAYKDPCSITEQSFDKLFNLIDNKRKIKDQAIFWSGTRTVVHDFTKVNHKFYTLEDTFPGFLADGLYWCSCPKCNTGYNTEQKCNKQCEPNNVYWQRASRNLAEKATGNVYVMLNSTPNGSDTAYYRGSHFGKEELPTLGKLGQVKKLVLLNVFSLGVNPRERCGTHTLKELDNDARNATINNIECIDDPKMVRFVLCSKYPDADECKFYTSSASRLGGCFFFLLPTLFVLMLRNV